MSQIETWSTNPALNNATPPDGFPENMQQKTYNNSAREVMAAVRTWFDDPQWQDFTAGNVVSKLSVAQVGITGIDLTGYFTAGRRILLTGGGDSVGSVVSSVFTAGNTEVTLAMDVGVVPDFTNAIFAFFAKDVRSAAWNTVGTAPGSIPLNTGSGALGSAAYKDQGNNTGQVPLNTQSAALAAGAYKAVSDTIGDLAVHAQTGPLKAGAYLAPPVRSFTKKTANHDISGSEVAILQLVNIAIPGTPDGVKKYEISLSLLIHGLTGNNSDNTMRIRVGTAGTIADAIVLEVPFTVFQAGNADNLLTISRFEITPAASTKVTLSLANNFNVRVLGVAPQQSFLEIREIQ